ncbi:MAG: NAD(P)/FAD-dependent oxidoreductase [Actinomycetota bacterium]|nr:NAD(P)/FAD-dependent oxidoreductase [Actinomycetota bacterium]
MEKSQKNAIIIGAGPAGLTAAYELLDKTDIKPLLYEMSGYIGGISRTIVYKGNRMDIGGHRFFSKSDRVMEWWTNILPLQGVPPRHEARGGERVVSIDSGSRGQAGKVDALKTGAPNPDEDDEVMLVRNRLSRILFQRKLFDYPVSLNLDTLSNLGLVHIAKVALSYIRARLFPIRDERSLEDFFINRFGRELYSIFFKDYTRKVWGVPCHDINPEWGAQRVKGLSVTKALLHSVNKMFSREKSLSQKGTETSLIERFIYPKYGPGQLWEKVARIIEEGGGEVHLEHKVIGINHDGGKIREVTVRDERSGSTFTATGDYFISTMPVKDLIEAMGGGVPEKVSAVARNLVYRDFITVGLLLRKLGAGNGDVTGDGLPDIPPDNWIYVQEKDLKVSRLQIFNNWSPYLVKDAKTVWLGMEYMCDEDDNLWKMNGDELQWLARSELVKMSLAAEGDILDGVVIKMTKVYPAYFGSYDRFSIIREYTDGFDNLFLIGRNGMHRYNNQDHSMLTAMAAVENILTGSRSKDNIWAVNAEEEYHEKK